MKLWGEDAAPLHVCKEVSKIYTLKQTTRSYSVTYQKAAERHIVNVVDVANSRDSDSD